MNEAYFEKIYAENRLKNFRIRKMQIKDVKETKFNLTLIRKNVENFKKRAEIVKENSEKNFEMLKKKFDQI